tara:strand:- start:368 stop:601 length:234 start_codon:yes stop_codon:yes gene_type:complete
MQAIQVRYLNPTNTKGARLKAWTHGAAMVQPFNSNRDRFPQSRELAQSLIDSLDWGIPITGAGMLKNGDDVFTVGIL